MSAETKPPAAVDQRVSAIGLQPLQSNGMKYRNLCRSGLRVSAVGVGCFPFGGLMDDQIVQSTVDCAIDLGINYFDTSDSYGIGKSESSLGRALLGKRSKAVIATKFGNRTGDEANDTGASRTHIIEACEASLRRLQTDHIDVYQVHWPDHNTPIEETLRLRKFL
jgi:aryl-alcohol dehydrogenase-like predicted oxidoreductase